MRALPTLTPDLALEAITELHLSRTARTGKLLNPGYLDAVATHVALADGAVDRTASLWDGPTWGTGAATVAFARVLGLPSADTAARALEALLPSQSRPAPTEGSKFTQWASAEMETLGFGAAETLGWEQVERPPFEAIAPILEALPKADRETWREVAREAVYRMLDLLGPQTLDELLCFPFPVVVRLLRSIRPCEKVV